MRWLLPLATGALVLAGCEEELTVPGRCPELCPGGQPLVQDTVVLAIEGSDTAFFGYSGHTGTTSLLVSNGLEAGEARSWVRFPQRSDSVTVSSVVHPYTTDSVVFAFNLVARDTLVSGLKLYLHRVPLAFDSLTTFPDIEAALGPASLIDSIAVPDSVKSGTIRALITDSTTLANLIPPDDSGRLALGIQMVADEPTGVRLSAIGGSGGAAFATYVKADVADTALQRQTISLSSEDNGFALASAGDAIDPDLLYAGRRPSGRSVLRFPIPDFFRDSSVILVRATLELTPAEPLLGLRGDAALIDIRGVIKDIGAKSTPSFAVNGSASLPTDGSTALFAVDVLGIVQLWGLPEGGLPPTVLVALAPDGGSFHRPVFRSTRSAEGKPRLRITYMRPSQVEQP